MAPRFPDFFIVGAPKCGTTSAADYLKRYPKIFMPRYKEPRYYSDPYSSSLFRVPRIADRDEYLRLFAGAPPGTITGEASPIYLMGLTAIADADADNPDAKFVAFVRNPIELAYALHWQMVLLFLEKEHDFERAWNGQVRGIQLGQSGSLPYRMLCSIGSHVRRFFKTIPPERRLVLVLDDFKTDPLAEARRLVEFLGVEFDPSIPWPHSNPRKTYRSWALARLVLGGRVSLALLQQAFLRTDSVTSRLLFKDEKAPPLRPAFRRQLAEEFRREVEILGQLLGRDFSAWLEPEPPLVASSAAS
jgi:hypothetical protein